MKEVNFFWIYEDMIFCLRCWRMNKKVVVIGLGYVGLLFVFLFVKKNYIVIGFDIDVLKIEVLK